MISISSDEMRTLDRKATEVYGIPSLLLMENAGRSTAGLILQKFDPKKVLIFCGKGNNGGDGFVIARHLANAGICVRICFLGRQEDLKGDAALNFQIVKKMGISLEMVSPLPDEKIQIIEAFLDECELVVDALLGIGIKKGIAGDFKKAIELINASGKPAVAVDIPSGMDADSGEVRGAAVKAVLTATMGLPKKGLLTPAGKAFSGEVQVMDIGLPKALRLQAGGGMAPVSILP